MAETHTLSYLKIPDPMANCGYGEESHCDWKTRIALSFVLPENILSDAYLLIKVTDHIPRDPIPRDPIPRS